jgi:hypothetical protein
MHLTERRYQNTAKADRPAQKLGSDLGKEIRITSEMMKAGRTAFIEWRGEIADADVGAYCIFKAMLGACEKLKHLSVVDHSS